VGPTATNVFPEDGSFTVAVRVTDSDGSSDIATLAVVVDNAPPVVEAGPDQTSVLVGDPVLLAPATFTDAGVLDTHTASIDWGDGTVESGTVAETDGSGTVGGSHAYAAAGTYVVTVTVTDDEGASGSDALSIQVEDDVALACDVDGNGVVDMTDIRAISLARNQPALPGDPRDYDGDGVITVNDARQCVLLCTNARCAP
jgi:predicted secreted protein